MNEAAQKLVAIAHAEIGVREQGTNSGERIVQYQQATWLEPGPWPWCAAFVAWCLRSWIGDEGVRKTLGLKGDGETWRCKDARAYGWEKWAQERGLWVLDEHKAAQPGDIVTYDFSHIGIVVKDSGSSIITIEGNTNSAGSREGDGVYAKIRARHLVRKFIRIVKSEPPQPQVR